MTSHRSTRPKLWLAAHTWASTVPSEPVSSCFSSAYSRGAALASSVVQGMWMRVMVTRCVKLKFYRRLANKVVLLKKFCQCSNDTKLVMRSVPLSAQGRGGPNSHPISATARP